jgi:hypothetical protein
MAFCLLGAPPHKKNGLIKRTWTFKHTFSRPYSGPSDAHPVHSALNRRHSSFLIIRPWPLRPQCSAHITVARAMSNCIDQLRHAATAPAAIIHPKPIRTSHSDTLRVGFMFCSPTMPGNPCPEIFIDGGSAFYCDLCVRCL